MRIWLPIIMMTVFTGYYWFTIPSWVTLIGFILCTGFLVPLIHFYLMDRR